MESPQIAKPLELGPGSPASLIKDKALSIFLLKCTKYVASLPVFFKYVVWRYTIGSGSINKSLIFGKITENNEYWCYLFFKYYKNTVGNISQAQLENELPKVWKKFGYLFHSAGNDLKLLTAGARELVVAEVTDLYTETLDLIIENSPPVGPGGITVYKIAGQYPGLPEIGANFKKTSVLQVPFNSTTVNPHFNFMLFSSPGESCCMFVINIPEGSHVLYVPAEYHAYPAENEVLLPKGCSLDIYAYTRGTLDYVNKDAVNIKMVQEKENILIGPVYVIDEFQPCNNSYSCVVGKVPFNYFLCKYRSPK